MNTGGGVWPAARAYETTPDGRMGWEQYFVRAGRSVYVVDQVGRGRSGFDAAAYNRVRVGMSPPATQPPIAMISHEFAWTFFRIGPKFGTPFADTQFPVKAVNAFSKMWIPDLNAALAANNPSYADLAALAHRLGGAVLMGHSESMMFPEHAALIDPNDVKGIISLESVVNCAKPFTPQQTAVLAKIPILVVFADHLADAAPPYGAMWAKSETQCRAFIARVREAGGDVTFLSLPAMGIHGNTHMFMLDKNNLQIADLLLGWINRHVGT